MKYEYNGNLLEEERIALVANEIMSAYPHITLGDARQAAMLEGKITTEKTIEIEFNRLYNIMLILSYNRNNVRMVYTDLVKILMKNENVKNFYNYYNILIDIASYLSYESDFPFLNEF